MIDQEPFLPKGIYTVHTEKTGPTQLDCLTYKERVDSTNNNATLRELFFGDKVRKCERIQDYWVSLMYPNSGYSEGSLMSVAAHWATLSGSTKTPSLIYDLPESVQTGYWQTLLAPIRRFQELKSQRNKLLESFGKGTIAFITGSHAREIPTFRRVRNEGNIQYLIKKPSSRTLNLPHDHLVFINPDNIQREDWDDSEYGLPQEHDLLFGSKRPNLTDFVGSLNEGLRNTGVAFNLRTEMPHGYEVQVGLTAEEFSAVLKNHYEVYKKVMHLNSIKRVVTRQRDILAYSIMTQPAFIFFCFPLNQTEGKIIFSPDIAPIAGPERIGIKLLRGPEYPKRVPESTVSSFHKVLLKI